MLLSNIKQQNLNMRPITAGVWNSQQKPAWGIIKNSPSAIELEANRLRPKVVNALDRERLYEDVLKQKLTVNAYKEENLKLKTRLQMLE